MSIYSRGRAWVKAGAVMQVEAIRYIGGAYRVKEGTKGIVHKDGTVSFAPYTAFNCRLIGNCGDLPACMDDSCGRCLWCLIRPLKRYNWKKL